MVDNFKAIKLCHVNAFVQIPIQKGIFDAHLVYFKVKCYSKWQECMYRNKFHHKHECFIEINAMSLRKPFSH